MGNPFQDDVTATMLERVRAGWMPRREFIRRGSVLGLSVGTLGALLAACGSDSESSGASDGETPTPSGSGAASPSTAPGSSPAPSRGGTLRIAQGAPTRELDPLTGYGTGFNIIQYCHDYLVVIDNDYDVLPSLATEWTPSEAAKVWTFILRDGVTFHDGTPLTPEAVVATYERMVDPDGGSAALSAFKGVLSPGGTSVGPNGEIVFTLDRPFSDFPYLCSQANYTSVILKEDYAGGWLDNPVGTGPFMLESIDLASGATLVRNESYWDEGKPYLDTLSFTFYADTQAMVLGIQADEADTCTIDFVQARALTSDPTITVDQVRGTGCNIFTMRVDTPPFDRKEVRQAVAWAINRAAVIERVLDGGGELGNDHLIAPAYKAAPTSLTQREVDTEKVAELLGGEQISFTLSYGARESASLAQVYIEHLTQAGFDVTPEEMPDDEFFGGDQVTDTPWLFRPATLVVWAARPTPSQFIGPMITTDGVWNGAKYYNAELDAAAAEYDAAETDAAKAEVAETIATILWEDAPMVIGYWGGQARATREGFSGLTAGFFQIADVGTA